MRLSCGAENTTPTSRLACQTFEPFDPGHAERFRVGHEVRLGHGDEIAGAEIFSDLDLMRDRPPCSRAELAGPHRFFFFG
jgi:hypothetical protein